MFDFYSKNTISAVIYARYSSDLQNPKSVEDQIAYCKDNLSKIENISVIQVFHDSAIPGTKNKSHRKGLNDLIDFISKNKIDIVAFESLDRLSRDAEYTHHLNKILKFHNARMYSINEGLINELMIGLKSTMNMITLKETADRILRSQKERAKEGIFPAGNPYGYRAKLDAVDEKGKRRNGVKEIVEKEALVVKRIFEMYADGAGSKAIARRLNLEGIPSPSGGSWINSTILGTRNRDGGILGNSLYKGLLTYNRTKKIINPVTGKMKVVVKPKSEWVVTPVPDLRIISDDLWNKVQARRLQPKKKLQKTDESTSRSLSTKHLSGMIYCGVCGSKSQRANYSRYVCGSYRNQKGCLNARGLRESILTEKIFSEIKDFVKKTDFRNEFNSIFEEEIESIKEKKKQFEKIEKRIRGYSYVIEDGVYLPAILEGLKKLQSERAQILTEINKAVPTLPSEAKIKRSILSGISELEEQKTFDMKSFAFTWRASLSLVVKKVITTPIPNKRQGMTVEVKIAPMEGWAEFYRRVTAKKSHV